MTLTERDLHILREVGRHRLLRSTHITALTTGSAQTTLRRLQLLFHHGYLDRPLAQLSWYARGSEPMVYALGNGGGKRLATVDGKKPCRLRWDTTNGRLTRMFLEHRLAVADVMVAFEVACRQSSRIRFIRPEEILAKAPKETHQLRLPFRWQVDVRVKGELVRLGVEPDKVFGLSLDGVPDSRRHAFFFLEADRGTMPVARMGLRQSSVLRKLLAYEATWRRRLHTLHLGIPNFRVLVVTSNPLRMQHLVEAGRSFAGGSSRLFLYSDCESLRSRDILTVEWTNGRGERVRITPTLTPSAFLPGQASAVEPPPTADRSSRPAW